MSLRSSSLSDRLAKVELDVAVLKERANSILLWLRLGVGTFLTGSATVVATLLLHR